MISNYCRRTTPAKPANRHMTVGPRYRGDRFPLFDPLPRFRLLMPPSTVIVSLPCGPWSKGTIKHRTAIFRQVNKEVPTTHHDALEFPDGQIVLLTFLEEGQQATVLQLPVTHEGTRPLQPKEANV